VNRGEFNLPSRQEMVRRGLVSIVTRRRAARLENLCSIPDGDRNFTPDHHVQPALEPIQSFLRVRGAFSPETKQLGR
jgi:hypothetical protein